MRSSSDKRGRAPAPLPGTIPVVDANGDAIAYVPLTLGRARAEEQARLIAEAPKMLEVVRTAHERFRAPMPPAAVDRFAAACRALSARLGLRG